MRYLQSSSRLLALLLTLGAVVAPSVVQARTPVPSWPEARGEQCVEPTAVIRRNHMQFLKHHRDDTMHQGIRTKRHSLKGCIECHAAVDDNGAYIPVNAPGQFCQSCHGYASVTMDCFQCHATKPADQGERK